MSVVSALYIYPIKSCRGIRVREWRVVKRGFDCDRRWMIVDETGNFVTLRTSPELILVKTHLTEDTIEVGAPGLAPLTLPLNPAQGEQRAVQVWNDQVSALVHPAGSAFFSSVLGAAHELVYMPDSEQRRVNPARARAGDIVSFADAYPFLIISEASLADLNTRLPAPISMERFRPNIVISDSEAYEEDSYAQVRIGEISFRGPKRCERCVVTTVDPDSGERGKEPLRTLAQYRQEDSKVWFGMNLIHDGVGTLRVGDAVESLA